MEPNIDHQRQEAHELLDMLPAEKLNAVRSLLEVMVEPMARTLASAPLDDDNVSPETAEALARARESLDRGEGISHDDVLREFGLKH